VQCKAIRTSPTTHAREGIVPENIVPERGSYQSEYRTRENTVPERVRISDSKSHQNRNDDESKQVSKKITVGAKTGPPQR
jgi:hypothetical protein